MPHAENFGSSLPRGLVAYERMLEVAGVQHHKAAALRFIAGKDHELAFQPEPDNPKDPNAVRVMGISRTGGRRKRYHIGYVEREVAAALVASGQAERAIARLLRIYVGDGGFIAIRYAIGGPPEGRDLYVAAFGEDVDEDGEEELDEVLEPLTATPVGPTKVPYMTGPLATDVQSQRKSGGCMKAIGLGVAIFLGLAVLGTCLPDAGAAPTVASPGPMLPLISRS